MNKTGASVVLGKRHFNTNKSTLLKIFEDYENIYGGKWAVETDISKMAGLIIGHINNKREKLGISKGKERVLFDMEMRREIEK